LDPGGEDEGAIIKQRKEFYKQVYFDPTEMLNRNPASE
jgi:hypothetical protein